MLSPTALDQWIHQAHSPRIHDKAIAFKSQKIETYEIFADAIGTSLLTLEEINKDCQEYCTPDVSVTTLRRWWYEYVEWGELPHRVSQRKRRMKARNKGAR